LILHEVFPAHKAGSLGEYLDILHHSIETMRRDSNHDSNEFFSKVINYWLDNDRDKSWTKLADAVELCDCGNVANSIRDKYVRSPAAEHRSEESGKLVGHEIIQLLLEVLHIPQRFI